MVRNDIKKEFGDYQTPGYFAVKVCNLLKDKLCLLYTSDAADEL